MKKLLSMLLFGATILVSSLSSASENFSVVYGKFSGDQLVDEFSNGMTKKTIGGITAMSFDELFLTTNGYIRYLPPDMTIYQTTYSSYVIGTSSYTRNLTYRPIEEIRTLKMAEIDNSYYTNGHLPVSVNGILFEGGYESAQKIDGARRMIEEAANLGLIPASTPVYVHDTTGSIHSLTQTEAIVVALTIGQKYQQDFAKMSQLKLMINTETDPATLVSINW